MIQQPLYAIDQEVYAASAPWKSTRILCPDCLGSAKWSVTTPAGEVFEVRCNTCNEGWESSGTIREYGYQAKVERLTIGSIRMDTHDENPISYMCKETGVGSGSIHYESKLFRTHEEAMNHAMQLAKQYTEERFAQSEKDRARTKKNMVYKPKKKAS